MRKNLFVLLLFSIIFVCTSCGQEEVHDTAAHEFDGTDFTVSFGYQEDENSTARAFDVLLPGNARIDQSGGIGTDGSLQSDTLMGETVGFHHNNGDFSSLLMDHLFCVLDDRNYSISLISGHEMSLDSVRESHPGGCELSDAEHPAYGYWDFSYDNPTCFVVFHVSEEYNAYIAVEMEDSSIDVDDPALLGRTAEKIYATITY